MTEHKSGTRVPQAPVWSELVLMGAGALTAWWALGDLSAKVPPGTRLDYFVEPPFRSPTTDLVLGVIGLAVAVVIVARAKGMWRLPYVGAFVLGGVLGFFCRVLTAGVIGANIGAGLVFMIGLPLVAVVAAGLFWLSRKLARTP
ncbi:hypothetical protein [Allokutzneria oryzae]|uniref:DUF4345 domain-containing protein n=1 Tax=Allokutzneria oryzae TaxID=1378989 RepID=A0ABV6A1C7_9PSEU